MFDAHPAHFKVVGDVVFPGEVPHMLAQSSGFDVFGGRKVIRHQSNLVLVEYGTADLIEFIDGRRPGNIIGQGQIDLGNQQFPFFYLRTAGMAGQDFLCSCHSHNV